MVLILIEEPMSGAKLRDSAVAIRADEVRALRDEFGWTQEQLADSVGVSPLEVSAWEAGSLPVDPGQAVEIARERCRALRERGVAAAGLEPCAWAAAMGDLHTRLQKQERLRVASAVHARIERHRKRCPACRAVAEVERSIPEPQPPLPHTPAGWIARIGRVAQVLPEPFGRIAAMALLSAAALCGISLFMYIDEPSKGFPLPTSHFLVGMAGFSSLVLVGRLLGDLYDDHPYWAGFLHSAAVTAAAGATLAWRAGWSLGSPALWICVALAAGVCSFFLGVVEDDARDEERWAFEAGGAAGGGEVDDIRNVAEAGRYEH